MDQVRAHHHSRTGWISERVYAVAAAVSSFYVYTQGPDTVCIDAGTSPRVAAAGLRRIGIDPAAVSHVFLTHSDGDHTGGISAFPHAKILLPRAEEPMASGDRLRRVVFLRHRNHVRVGWIPVDDGEIVIAGEISVRAIATPGHTVGSTSYLVNDDALFTGDLLILRRGRARPTPAYISEDTDETLRSLWKLAAEVNRVAILCTAHSGYTTDYAAALAEWRAGTPAAGAPAAGTPVAKDPGRGGR